MTDHFDQWRQDKVLQHLLALPPVARTTDPETSKEAAEDIRKSGKSLSDARKIAKVIAEHGDLTLREIVPFAQKESPRFDVSTVSKRISDASREPLCLIFSPYKRRCSVSGRKAQAWRRVGAKAQKVAA